VTADAPSNQSIGLAVDTPASCDCRDTVLIEISSSADLLAPVRAFVTTLASRWGFDENAQFQMALAVDEAVANVINHGYRRRPDGRIWLQISRVSAPREGVIFVIDDEGEQVDPCQIRSRDLDDIRPGGLGVHIIREVMDGCVWERRPQGGMRLTLTKFQAPGFQAPGFQAPGFQAPE